MALDPIPTNGYLTSYVQLTVTFKKVSRSHPIVPDKLVNTLRNALKPVLPSAELDIEITSFRIFDLRPENLPIVPTIQKPPRPFVCKPWRNDGTCPAHPYPVPGAAPGDWH